jgi:glutamate synthase (NADPH/NADH) large chain
VALEKVLSKEEQEAQVDRALWHRGATDEALLRKLVEDHHRWTGSLRARDIIDHWADARGRFVKVFPHEYRRALGEMNAARQTDATIAKARTADARTRPVPAK